MSTPNWNAFESSVALDNPASRPLVPPRATPLASDLFTATDGAATDINGREPDNGFGGASGLAWARNVAASYAIANNTLVRGTDLTSARATLPIANGDVEAGYLITAVPQSDGHSLFLDVRLNVAAGSSSTRNAYRLQLTRINGSVRVQLQRRAGGGVTVTASYPVKIGDRVAIRVVGGTVLLLINNYDMETFIDSTPLSAGAHVGFESGANAVFGVDEFYVEQIL
ncbi:hypothetical protein [Microbacterium testaceum]|uniref:Uncharacterized protein n=1 Tax=Microbacterium testaceum TaxID=2033 RepID=A0A147F4P0_MICTE|nr:hypothetical protein [Microbacterium testaceum]KTS09026.1 hypothetical protein RSA3_14070 [Microbacterium testaceum]